MEGEIKMTILDSKNGMDIYSSWRDKILLQISSSVFADKKALISLSKNKRRTYEAIKNLSEENRIKETPNGSLRFTLEGINYLQEKRECCYSFYMQFSNNNHPGGTSKHLLTNLRASKILICCAEAGVAIGPQKKSLSELEELNARYNQEQLLFYLNKEIKVDKEQMVTRSTLSRSTGIILSPGITGLIYNSLDAPLQLNRVAEKEANIRATIIRQKVICNAPQEPIKDSIILFDDDHTACRIIETRRKTKAKSLIGDAINDKNVTRTNFRYIPCTKEGVTSLGLITTYTQQDFIDMCFTEEERQKGMSIGADAEIKSLACYEFLSCNITKLAMVKNTCGDISKIGIVCWEGQVEFLKEFFGRGKPLHLRIMSRQAVENLIEKGRKANGNEI